MAALMEEREFSRQQSPEQVVQVEEIFFEAPPMMSDASPSSNRLRLETISNENPRRRSSKTSLSSKNANVLRTSEAFQGLLDRLAQQHLQELLAAELGSCGLGISEAFPRRPGGSSANVGCASASSADFVKKKGSINSIRAKRRKEATEVQAKEILDVWEGDDPVGIEELEIYAHQLQREVERAQAPQKAADGPARRKPWTESFAFDAFIATLVGLNVLWMAFQLQLQGSQAANDLGISQWMEMGDFTGWQTAFLVGDTLFAIIFALDVGVRIYFLRRRFWRKWMNWLDLLISIICLGEIVLISVAPVTPNLVVLRILRFARFARALRLVAMSAALASLQLLIKCLIACKSMLLWSFCLLAFVQSVAGLVISSICWDFIRDPSADHFGREQACAREGLVAAPGSQ
ncbi:unnamed protein product [Effrenium voratum]|uniref:Ion transport domain-containing protein n=1 Tax=Effrenium voratum TaxID=2562239 RepID=A0AA36IRU6_9DINO|nr:unnamed protein product [Effrenium voratum]